MPEKINEYNIMINDTENSDEYNYPYIVKTSLSKREFSKKFNEILQRRLDGFDEDEDEDEGLAGWSILNEMIDKKIITSYTEFEFDIILHT